jgi:hypothetical protein
MLSLNTCSSPVVGIRNYQTARPVTTRTQTRFAQFMSALIKALGAVHA